MTIRYFISREEHKEICQPHIPKADWASSVAAVFVAVGLVVLAAGVVAANSRQGGWVAVILGLVAVVMVGVALYEPTLGTWIRRYGYVRRIRTLYRENLQDKEQEFLFDEQGWRSQDATGGAVPWADLRVAVEYAEVFYLQSGEKYAIVPKQILPAEALTQLRRLALGEFVSPFARQVGLRHHLQVEIPSLWRRRKSEMVGAHIAGVVATVMVTAWLWKDHSPRDIPWIIGISGSLLFITISTQFWYHLTVYLSQWRWHTSPSQMECSERGVHVRSRYLEYFSAWPVFPKFREIAPAFLLYIDRTQYYIVPKSNLSTDQAERLRQMLQSKLSVADSSWA